MQIFLSLVSGKDYVNTINSVKQMKMINISLQKKTDIKYRQQDKCSPPQA